jgi:hypothetical protein
MGSINIELRKMGLHENKAGDEGFHFSYVAEANLVFSGHAKANNIVLDQVKIFIDSLN